METLIRFRTLGRIDLRDASGRTIRSILDRRKRLGLLAYLCLAEPSGIVQRDSLLALFWPELPEARARHALNQALHVLRKGTDSRIFLSRGTEEVGVDPARLWCDARSFRDALDGGRLEEALELYGGDLLEGFHMSGAPGFERWHGDAREALRRRAGEAARSLARAREAQGDLPGALYWLRAAAARAPHDEEVLHDLMDVLLRRGDRTGALREYDSFERRLAVDLEVEPSDRVAGLVDRIRNGERAETPPAGVGGGEGAAGEIPAAPAGRATGVAVTDQPARVEDSGGRRRQVRRFLPVVALAAGAMAVVLFQLGGRGAESAPPAAPLAPNRVLVAPLDNRTGDSELDALGSIASSWVTEGLGRTGMVEVVPYATQLRATRPGEDMSFTRDIALRANAGLMIAGEYYRRQDSLFFHVRLVRSGSGELVRAFEPVMSLVDDPMHGIDELRRRSMGALAVQVDPRLASWAEAASYPPNITAYRLYTEGIERFARGQYQGSIDRFDEAAAVDSRFKAPAVWTVHSYAWAGRAAEADSVLNELEPGIDGLAPWEAAMVDYYRASLHQEWAGAHAAARRLVQIAPRSEWTYLLAAAARMLGRPAEAVRHLEAVGPELAVNWFPYWTALLGARHQAGDYAGELRDARRRRSEASDCCRTSEIRALIALGHPSEALGLLEVEIAERNDWRGKSALLESTAGELLGHSFPADARRLFQRALALRLSRTDRAVPTEAIGLARALYRVGRLDEAEALLVRIGPEEPTGNQAGYLALIAAGRGGVQRAVENADWYTRLDERGAFWAAVWNARIAAALNEPERAVSLLGRAMAAGEMGVFPWLHSDPELAPLFDYAPFQALIRGR